MNKNHKRKTSKTGSNPQNQTTNQAYSKPHKTPWIKLGLVVIGLLLIPRASSRQADYVKKH